MCVADEAEEQQNSLPGCVRVVCVFAFPLSLMLLLQNQRQKSALTVQPSNNTILRAHGGPCGQDEDEEE